MLKDVVNFKFDTDPDTCEKVLKGDMHFQCTVKALDVWDGTLNEDFENFLKDQALKSIRRNLLEQLGISETLEDLFEFAYYVHKSRYGEFNGVCPVYDFSKWHYKGKPIEEFINDCVLKIKNC